MANNAVVPRLKMEGHGCPDRTRVHVRAARDGRTALPPRGIRNTVALSRRVLD